MKMTNMRDDSTLSILEKIDLRESPDDTLVQRVNEMWFGWMRALVSGIFDSYSPIPPTSESVVQMILKANEDHYIAKRSESETYPEGSSGYVNRERGLYIYMFAAVVCLMELRVRYPFSEMDEVFTEMLGSDHIHIRTASGLAQLAMGNEDVELDLEGLEQSIVLGAFFSFPLNYYFHILHNLLKREDLCRPTAKMISAHYDKRFSQEGPYYLFRLFETAMFLALAGELSKQSLTYLVWKSEGNAWNDIELAYVKRIRKVLVELIETNPEARQIIADYMITEGRKAIGWEFISFYKAWEQVNWQNVDQQVVSDYLEIAGKVHAASWGYDSARVIVTSILPWPQLIPVVVQWFQMYVDSLIESDSKDDSNWESDLGADDEDYSDFLSRLIGGLGELARLEEITSSLLLLAQYANSIHLRFAALSTLKHFRIEKKRVQRILNEEKPRTAKYLQSLYDSPRFRVKFLHAGIDRIEVTDDEVADYLDRRLQYRPENFERFSC